MADYTRKNGVITNVETGEKQDFSKTRKDKDIEYLVHHGINAAKRKSRELQRTGNTVRKA